MSQKILTDLDFTSVARIRNLPTPANPDEPARLGDLQSAVEGIAWKDAARVSSQGNLNLAAPGAAIDGITMAPGDRVLVRAQSEASENGLFVWHGAAVPATRSVDASTAESLEGAVVTVEEGTDGGTTWRQTQVNFTLDVDDVLWTPFGTAAPAASETTAGVAEAATQAEVDDGTPGMRFVRPETLANWSGRARKAQANIGDNSANQFTLTHNFNSRDVLVQVVRNSAPYDHVIVDQERPTLDSVVLRFAEPPTTNQFRAIVIG